MIFKMLLKCLIFQIPVISSLSLGKSEIYRHSDKSDISWTSTKCTGSPGDQSHSGFSQKSRSFAFKIKINLSWVETRLLTIFTKFIEQKVVHPETNCCIGELSGKSGRQPVVKPTRTFGRINFFSAINWTIIKFGSSAFSGYLKVKKIRKFWFYSYKKS